MGSLKQHAIEVADLRYQINQATKELAQLRRFAWSRDSDREQWLMEERRRLRRQLRAAEGGAG